MVRPGSIPGAPAATGHRMQRAVGVRRGFPGSKGRPVTRGDRVNVLVTGHLGYIGTVMVPMLMEAGHRVVGLDTDLYRGSTFGDPSAIPSVPNINKDLRDVTRSDLDGFDAVVHLAALSN